MNSPSQYLPNYIHDFQKNSWKIFESEHYVFHVFKNSVAEKEIDIIIYTQEKAFEKVQKFLNENISRKIYCYFYPDRKEKEKLTGDDFWGQAIYAEFCIHAIYNSEHQVVGEHEVVHLLSLSWGLAIPLFAEGLAEYLTGHDWQGNSFVKNLQKYGIEKLKPISDFMNYQSWIDIPDEEMFVMYSYAGALSQFLIEKYGQKKYEECYRKLSRNHSGNVNTSIYETVYTRTLCEINEEWKEWIVTVK